MSYPTGIEVDEAFAYLDDIARGHSGVPAPCHKLLGAALVLRSEVVGLRKQLEHAIEQRDAEERAAMHSGGLLSDVCDIAFANTERAMRNGYDGIRERVAFLVDLAGEQRDSEELAFLLQLHEALQRDKKALDLPPDVRDRVHARLFGQGPT